MKKAMLQTITFVTVLMVSAVALSALAQSDVCGENYNQSKRNLGKAIFNLRQERQLLQKNG